VTKVEDVIIVGGGPAGISCAIQLIRHGIKASIIEKEHLGGLLLNANKLENYPGFPGGIKGTELVKFMKKQLRKQKVKVLFEEVTALDLDEKLVKVTTNRSYYYSKYVVISSGTKPKEFKQCPIPDELISRIFYEVYPINTIENKKIAIIGAGDVAFDYALNLEKHNKIVLLNRSETSKCIPILFERVRKSSKIKYIKGVEIKNVSSSSEDTITLESFISKGVKNIEADFLLFAIGRVPCLDFLSPELKNEIHKKKENVRMYLAGDVRNGIFRQTAIAVGDGTMAAMKIYNKIKEQRK
jgi:thioredoxin reductase (NADPH)